MFVNSFSQFSNLVAYYKEAAVAKVHAIRPKLLSLTEKVYELTFCAFQARISVETASRYLDGQEDWVDYQVGALAILTIHWTGRYLFYRVNRFNQQATDTALKTAVKTLPILGIFTMHITQLGTFLAKQEATMQQCYGMTKNNENYFYVNEISSLDSAQFLGMCETNPIWNNTQSTYNITMNANNRRDICNLLQDKSCYSLVYVNATTAQEWMGDLTPLMLFKNQAVIWINEMFVKNRNIIDSNKNIAMFGFSSVLVISSGIVLTYKCLKIPCHSKEPSELDMEANNGLLKQFS